jgi:hypothetical protein
MRPQRSAGACVILRSGNLIGYLGRTHQHLLCFLPESDPERSEAQSDLVRALVMRARNAGPLYLTKIDGAEPGDSELSDYLKRGGFVATSRGYLHRGD